MHRSRPQRVASSNADCATVVGNQEGPSGECRLGSMSKKLPISAFIISKNEEDRIAFAINSVKDWVYEVIVVDSGSEDSTVSIAEQLGAKVEFNSWPGYGAQKRFAEEKCKCNWVFNLDADEEITPELKKEIRYIFEGGVLHRDVYSIFISDVFPHEKRPARWAYGHWQYRLYDKRVSRFSDSIVHDTVRPGMSAKTARLRSKMIHRPQRSLAFAVEKMNRYSDAQVRDMVANNRTISRVRVIFQFPLAFLKSYFLRRNFLYGTYGWVHSVNYAFSRHLRVAKAYEQRLRQ